MTVNTRPGPGAAPIGRHLVLVVAICATALAVLFVPPIPQALSYHDFADHRACLGLQNCLNVLSNVPFAIVGVLGVAAVFNSSGSPQFGDRWERWPYGVLF